jgi:hypothetical protein
LEIAYEMISNTRRTETDKYSSSIQTRFQQDATLEN